MHFRSHECLAIRLLVIQISPRNTQLIKDSLNLLPMDAHVNARQQMPSLRIHGSEPGMSELYGGVEPWIFRNRGHHLGTRLLIFPHYFKRCFCGWLYDCSTGNNLWSNVFRKLSDETSESGVGDAKVIKSHRN